MEKLHTTLELHDGRSGCHYGLKVETSHWTSNGVTDKKPFLYTRPQVGLSRPEAFKPAVAQGRN